MDKNPNHPNPNHNNYNNRSEKTKTKKQESIIKNKTNSIYNKKMTKIPKKCEIHNSFY